MDNFLVIKEDKEKIQKIKEKYKNLEMADDTASKINKLEVTNKLLGNAMVVAGIATVIDIVLPDPIIGLDEATLVAITAAIKVARNNINSHIKELASEGDTQVTAEEVNNLSKRLISIAQKTKTSKTK